MTVGELAQLLRTLNQDMPVILASDAEGNEYHWLDGFAPAFVKTGTLHLTSIYVAEEIKEEAETAKEYGDEPPEFDPVLVLWP